MDRMKTKAYVSREETRRKSVIKSHAQQPRKNFVMAAIIVLIRMMSWIVIHARKIDLSDVMMAIQDVYKIRYVLKMFLSSETLAHEI